MNNVLALSGVVIKELYRRKDFYVLFVLTALITILLGSINIFNDEGIVRYIKEGCLLLIWLSSLVVSITTAARQIPAERENRTIFPLLAKPVSRAELIIGKFLGCWLASGLTLVVFYSFFGVISGTREHAWPFLQYIQALWLHWFCLAVIIGMALFGSIVFTAQSSNNTICFITICGLFFLGGHLNRVGIQMGGLPGSLLSAIYYVIPHLEWYDVRDLIVHNHGIINWVICGGATLYALLYTVILLGLTWLLFRRKSLSL